MRRREFMVLLGGAAVAWPIMARARHIGILMNLAADDPEAPARIAALAEGLGEFGWNVGGNLRIDYRWGAGDAERIRKEAAELVALAPDVILCSGSPSVAALQRATDRVPIVFVQVVDPVGSGFVESLARPNGNITGFSVFEYGIGGSGLNYSKRSRRG
jgi:putative tryptophan/tyrosine transport system substrate-binding protein